MHRDLVPVRKRSLSDPGGPSVLRCALNVQKRRGIEPDPQYAGSGATEGCWDRQRRAPEHENALQNVFGALKD